MRDVRDRLVWFLGNDPVAEGRCAEHTMHAIDLPRQGYPDAASLARKVGADGHMQTSDAVPQGACRYWLGGSQGHGHVALEASALTSASIVASTDVNGPATVGARTFRWFGDHWSNLHYVGWSWWFGAINTQPKEDTVGWTEGQDQIIEKQNVVVEAGKYVAVGRIEIPKPGSFLLTFQTRLPAGRYGRWQFTRIGWGGGQNAEGRDPTGPNPMTPPDKAATSFTHTHRIEGGGPVDFEIKVAGTGSVTLPYVIMKAERIT